MVTTENQVKVEPVSSATTSSTSDTGKSEDLPNGRSPPKDDNVSINVPHVAKKEAGEAVMTSSGKAETREPKEATGNGSHNAKDRRDLEEIGSLLDERVSSHDAGSDDDEFALTGPTEKRKAGTPSEAPGRREWPRPMTSPAKAFRALAAPMKVVKARTSPAHFFANTKNRGKPPNALEGSPSFQDEPIFAFEHIPISTRTISDSIPTPKSETKPVDSIIEQDDIDDMPCDISKLGGMSCDLSMLVPQVLKETEQAPSVSSGASTSSPNNKSFIEPIRMFDFSDLFQHAFRSPKVANERQGATEIVGSEVHESLPVVASAAASTEAKPLTEAAGSTDDKSSLLYAWKDGQLQQVEQDEFPSNPKEFSSDPSVKDHEDSTSDKQRDDPLESKEKGKMKNPLFVLRRLKVDKRK